jgi:hypothetical protein
VLAFSFFFDRTGPDHMSLLIWPVKGVELVGWSASKEIPLADSFYTERPLYFVTYFYGVQPDVPYELTVTLKVSFFLLVTSAFLFSLEAILGDKLLLGDERLVV